MAASVEDRVLDLGLNVLDTEATHLRICTTEPTNYTEANSTYSKGFKNWGAGGVFGAPAAGSPGRKVSSTAILDGTVNGTGTVAYWAITDETNSRFLAHGALASSQAVTTGNTFSLGSFDIKVLNS